MRRIILAVLLAAVASLLAGCAGMTDGSTTDASGSDARQAERHQRPSGGY